MGLHLVTVTKFFLLQLQLAFSKGINPAVVVAWIIFMGMIKIFREEAVHKARSFFSRLGHIAYSTEVPLANSTRLDRAIRIIGQI